MLVIHARRLYVGTSAERAGLTLPADAVAALFFDTTETAFYAWSGSAWFAVGSGSAGWPFDKVKTVSSVDPSADYSSLSAALAAAVDGWVIELDTETYTLASVLSTNKSIKIRGQGRYRTIVQCDQSGFVLTSTALAHLGLEGLTIRHNGMVTGGCVECNPQTLMLNDVLLESIATGSVDNTGLKIFGGTRTLGYVLQSEISATAGLGTKIAIHLKSEGIEHIIFIPAGSVVKGSALGWAVKIESGFGGGDVLMQMPWIQGSGFPNNPFSPGDGWIAGRYIDLDDIGSAVIREVIPDGTTQLSAGVWLHNGPNSIWGEGFKWRFADIPSAITKAASGGGDIITLGPGSYVAPDVAGGITVDEPLSIVGHSPEQTIITRADDLSDTMTISDAGIRLRNLTIQNTGGGAGTTRALVTNQNGLVIDNCIISKPSGGAPSNGLALHVTGGDVTIKNGSKLSSTSGATKYAVVADTAASTIVIEAGVELNGATADIFINHSGVVVDLRGCKLLGGGINNAAGGTIRGYYINSSGHLVIIGVTDLLGLGSNFPDIGSTTLAQKFGDVYLGTAKDIFPQDSSHGLNARFERLFGDDRPAHDYSLTLRSFLVNDFVNHRAGFEDSQSDYSFGGSPGGFSFSKPASGYVTASNVRAHWLKMTNNNVASHLYLQWTDATAKTVLDSIIFFVPANLGVSNNLVAEIRFWAVQSPGVSDNYWGIRVVNMASTNTEWPFQIRLYKGTGTTFNLTDGTLVVGYPVVVQQALRLKSTLAATGQFQLDWSYAEGGNFALGTVVDASYPSNFKTMRALLPANGFQGMWIDQLEIT